MSTNSLRELLRSSEGVINRGDFRRGAGIVLTVTVALSLVLYGVYRLNHDMDWMTVTVAPFFGLVMFFIGCTLAYFWYCLFAKRLRGRGQTALAATLWLLLLAATGALVLVDYQNRTLDLASGGVLIYAGMAGILTGILSLLVFAGLLVYCAGGDRSGEGA